MAKVQTLIITTVGSQGQAASQPTHLVRLGELTVALAGKSDVGHVHTLAEITDLASGLPSLLAAILADSDGAEWTQSGSQMQLAIVTKPNGGVLVGTEGLRVDSGVVSLRGHVHAASEIGDLETSVLEMLAAGLADGQTIEWTISGSQIVGEVRTQAAGGLQASVGGLAIDFGDGHNQASRGDHTHAQLHNPVTLKSGTSIAFSLAGQLLGGEVRTGAGLKVTPNGVEVDFGPGHDQVMRGDAVPSGTGGTLVTANTGSLVLGIGDDGTLSGSVRLDSNPASGRGRIGVSGAGLYVALGTDATSAAAGDHTHAVATPTEDGFMSANDKARLNYLTDRLTSGTETIILDVAATNSLDLEVGDDGVMSGVVRRDLTAGANKGKLGLNFNGLYVQLGTTGDTAAPGNHTHANPSGTGFRHITDGVEDDEARLVTAVDLDPNIVIARSNLDLPSPSGTGFRHVTDGVEDGLARLVTAADVADDAAIPESKLALDFATHDPSNDPTSDEKGAMLGTQGTPSASNRFVTDSDPRLSGGGGGGGADLGELVVSGTMTFTDDLDPAIVFGQSGSTPPWSIRNHNEGGGGDYQLQFTQPGVVVLALKSNGDVSFLSNAFLGGYVQAAGLRDTSGNELIASVRGAAVDNATGVGTPTATSGGYGFATSSDMNNFVANVANAIAQLNALLSRLRPSTGHGLIEDS